jgi:hypothetical protein
LRTSSSPSGFDLAGETFRDEAELADARLFGQKVGRRRR